MQIRESHRACGFAEPTIALGATESSVVKCEEYSTGMIYFPQLFTGQDVTFKGSHVNHKASDANIHPMFATVAVAAGTDCTLAVNPLNWSPIPTEVMQMAAFKIVSDSAEEAARSMIVCMKS